jgi:molybdopterin synthase catalytic subunit
VGTVALGEPSVIVAVSAPHRAAAFAGACEIIDRIKDEVPIWKVEVDADGTVRRVVGSPAPGAQALDSARPSRSLGGEAG